MLDSGLFDGSRYDGSVLIAAPPSLPSDFLAALVAFWSETSSLAGISPELYYGAAQPGAIWNGTGYYPYATIQLVGSKRAGQNTGRGYWEDKYYEISVFYPDEDQVVTLGEIVIAVLDPIADQPLVFQNGYQMAFYCVGDSLRKVPGTGAGGATIVHRQSYTYRAKVGRLRTGTRPA